MTSGSRSAEAAPGQRPGRLALARAVTTVALILPALALALHVANSHTPVTDWWLGLVVMAVVLSAMGGLLATRATDNPIGWIFLAGGIGQGLTALGHQWAIFGYATRPGSLPAPDWAAWLGWGSAVGFATLPLVLLRIPDGKLPGRFAAGLQIVVVAAAGVSVLDSMITPGDYTEDMPGLRNPIGIDWGWLDAASTAAWIALSVSTLLAAGVLVLRWRRASPELRRNLRWVTIAGVAMVFETFLENTPLGAGSLFFWLSPIVFLIFIGTITVSVLRHRLWDVEVLVDLSLVYAIVTVLVGAAFVVLVVVAGKVFDGGAVVWPALVATGVTALAFVPLRNRIADLVDRIRRGGRGDLYRALGVMSRGGDRSDPVAQLQEAVDLVAAESPSLDYVCVTSSDGMTAWAGAPRGSTTTLPLDHQGSRVGTLTIAYRPGFATARPGANPGGSAWDPLTELAARMAEVVTTVAMNKAVVESRRAVALAREEERRRLRRDLHDGLGPALAAIAMRADSARLLIGADPIRAGEILVGLGDEVRSTIADVRRLVYDLQPPVLDAMGLVAAIGEQAAALSGPSEHGIDLTVELLAPQDIPGLSAAVEVATYRIACEALANVVRHSAARHCVISLTREGQMLWLSVDDDGIGHDAAARRGVGTASMIERATELGGRLLIGASAMGGTRVLATLPLGPPSAQRSSVTSTTAAAPPAGDQPEVTSRMVRAASPRAFPAQQQTPTASA